MTGIKISPRAEAKGNLSGKKSFFRVCGMPQGCGGLVATHSEGSGVTKTALASSYGVLSAKMNSSSVVGIQSGEAESTTMPACRASPVVVVLDLIVAKQTDLVAALAWPEVLVSHIHVLHTEWAACDGTDRAS